MRLFQSVFVDNQWQSPLPQQSDAQWVIALGNRVLMQDPIFRQAILQAFPKADLVGCTTSGEIQSSRLYDNSICLTAIEFEQSHMQVVSASIQEHDNALVLGKSLGQQLPHKELRHAFVIADGQLVNGSELITGLQQSLPSTVMITGGLAGDADRFQETIVWHNDMVTAGLVVVVGLYGDRVQIGHGHLGGWRPFGPYREITKSVDNVVYEIDNQPALDLYKTFLGDFAKELPASALRFPLALKQEAGQETVVRTILSINEQDKSMLFAGNVPEGAYAQLMHANYENLLDGAQGAAEQAIDAFQHNSPLLALLVSCVGRRLVLNQRIEEELEIIEYALPDKCTRTGFYSYGEISPMLSLGRCELHNQTMTITLIAEKSE